MASCSHETPVDLAWWIVSILQIALVNPFLLVIVVYCFLIYLYFILINFNCSYALNTNSWKISCLTKSTNFIFKEARWWMWWVFYQEVVHSSDESSSQGCVSMSPESFVLIFVICFWWPFVLLAVLSGSSFFDLLPISFSFVFLVSLSKNSCAHSLFQFQAMNLLGWCYSRDFALFS